MKTELLHLMKNDDRPEAIKAVLLSGLLPDDLLQKFLDDLTERAIRRVLSLPGCPEWAGRASWDAWAIKRLHSKDKDSVALLKATERIIALTTREAQQQVEKNGAAYADAPIWAAAEAARASHREQCGPLRHYALLASWASIRTARNAAMYPLGSSPGVTKAAKAANEEREQQYQDLLSLINSLPEEV